MFSPRLPLSAESCLTRAGNLCGIKTFYAGIPLDPNEKVKFQNNIIVNLYFKFYLKSVKKKIPPFPLIEGQLDCRGETRSLRETLTQRQCVSAGHAFQRDIKV